MSQIATITLANLRTLPQRMTASLVVVFGMACVSGVLVAMLATADGFNRMMAGTGRADRYIVMDLASAGISETYSTLTREWAAIIINAPGVAHDAAGAPIASAEAFKGIRLDAPGGRTSALIRGVGAAHATLRPEFRIVDGRMFQPGHAELIVGAPLYRRLGLRVGGTLRLRDVDWIVVGVFESGDSHESEFIGDAESVIAMLRTNAFQSVTARISSPQDLATFKAALEARPQLKIGVVNEADYYRDRTGKVGTQIHALAVAVGIIMAFGVLFGAFNTMYAAAAARLREMATLRAIGFTASTVLASLFIESLLLTLSGGILGAAISAAIFNRRVISTLATGDVSDSQITFAINVTPAQLAIAVACAAVIGLLGALLPAITMARMPVAAALQVR
jgi:putative ABC transport system permease protein